MSKPWDKLRVPPPKQPLAEGAWYFTHANGDVRWNRVWSDINGEFGVNVTVRGRPLIERIALSSKSARELGEFLIELADQLESQ